MHVCPRLGQDETEDYSGGVDYTAYEVPSYVTQPADAGADESFWNTPWFAASSGDTDAQGYDISSFWNSPGFAPGPSTTGGTNPVPGLTQTGSGGGGGGDVGGILSALAKGFKNLFNRGSSNPTVAATPAPVTILGMSPLTLGLVAVGAAVLIGGVGVSRRRRRRR